MKKSPQSPLNRSLSAPGGTSPKARPPKCFPPQSTSRELANDFPGPSSATSSIVMMTDGLAGATASSVFGGFPQGKPSVSPSPYETGGFPSAESSTTTAPPSTMVTSPDAFASVQPSTDTMASSFSEGALRPVADPAARPRVQRGRMDVLAPSTSLPQLFRTSPEQVMKLRRAATKKNNAEIRMRAAREMRGARSIYGGALVTPLPAMNPKEPFVPAKAALILPDRNQRKPQVENFNPRRSVPYDFFRSCKSKGLFDHYYQSQALEEW